jgi:hypothetical protein
MIDKTLKVAGIVLLVSGFALWSYGFFYSSLWYANNDISVLEPLRIWASEITEYTMFPDMVEQVIGLGSCCNGSPAAVDLALWEEMNAATRKGEKRRG